LVRNQSGSLQNATDDLLQSLSRGNPNLSRPSGYDRVNIAGRNGLRAVVSNRTSDGEAETIEIYSTQLRNGNLLYAIAVAPQQVYPSYRDVFDRVVSSIRLND